MRQDRLGADEWWVLGGLVALFVIAGAWWALALWPVTDAPSWLARTRYVCFGVKENGLPDAGGWIGLIAGPLGMLGILVVGWSRAVQSVLARARTSATVAAILTGLVLGTAFMIAGAGWRVRHANATEFDPTDRSTLPAADYPRLDRQAPALALVAQDGQARTLTSLRGRVVLVTFAYAHCTTVCPLIVRDVLAAQQERAMAVMIITLDPWRDTPARLASIARDWRLPSDDAWILGGSINQVEQTLSDWNVARSRNDQSGEVIHPSLVYIIDRQGRIAFAATGGAATIVALVDRLAGEQI